MSIVVNNIVLNIEESKDLLKSKDKFDIFL